MRDTGFSSIFECNVPREPYKPENRITVVATKGIPIKVSCYPWVNDKTENEIKAYLSDLQKHAQDHNDTRLSFTDVFKCVINGILRPFGFEMKRV